MWLIQVAAFLKISKKVFLDVSSNGSTFWFTLPYKQAETVKKSLPKDIQPIAIEKDKLVILIAEDNESNYKLFESILKYDYIILPQRWYPSRIS